MTSTRGKVIRINSDGTIPQDNPFIDGPGGNLDEIWAYGLRNPWRLTSDNETNRIFISEVGGNDERAREDLHIGEAGANYGWDGQELQGITGIAGISDPIFTYDHSESNDNSGAIAGGIVYRGDRLPSEFQGAYFFGDYAQNWIRYLQFDGNGNVIDAEPETPDTVEAFNFIEDGGNVVAFENGTDGYLYYLDIYQNPNDLGALRRISFTGEDANQAPEITTAEANVVSGSSPLTVDFTSSATDPEDDPLTYLWDFGDGSPQVTGENVTHTFENNGSYEVTLVVSDNQTNSTTIDEPIDITVGLAPDATITSPTDGNLFRAGDLITLTGSATDADSTLTDDNYSWEVRFLHNTHFHPEENDLIGSGQTFQVDTTGHLFTGDTGFEIILTVTDSDGLSDIESVIIRPEKVDLTFTSNVPGGVDFTLDGSLQSGSFVVDTAINFDHSVIFPEVVNSGGLEYTFESWSDGVTTPNRSLVVPDANQTYTANYTVTGESTGLPVTDGLVLSLDADSGVATDGNGIVTGWTDGSGSGNDLSSTGDPLLVTGGLNGNNIIDFDGDGDALQRLSDVNGLPTGNGDRTVFVVANYESVGNGGFTYGQPSRGQAFGLVVDENGNLGVQGWGNASDQISSEAGTNQGWLVQSAQLNGGTLTQYKNGTQIDSDAVNYNTALNQILLGAEIDGSPNLDMSVASVIVFDRALSETERQQVENYLQDRYLSSSTGGGNTDPIAVADEVSTDKETVFSGNVLNDNGNGADSDLDGDSLNVSAVNGEATNVDAEISLTSGALLTVNSDGSFSYDPNGQFASLAAGESATDSFDYTISDGNGGLDTATVNVTINGQTPDLIPDAINFSDYMFETGVNSSRALKVFDSVSSGELSGVDFVFDATPVGEDAHFHIPGNPEYLTQHNAAGNGVQIGFTFARQDGLPFAFESFDYTSGIFFGADVNAGFTVTGTLEGGGTVSQTFDAADTLETFQTAILNSPDWSNVTSVSFVGERIEPSGDPAVSPTQELNIDNVIVGLPSTTGVNQAPTAVADEVSTDKETVFSGNVLNDNGNGADSDLDGDSLNVSAVNGEATNVDAEISLTSGALLTVNSDGSFSYDPNGQFASLAAGESATDSFDYTISDGNGGIDTASVTITVTGDIDNGGGETDLPVTQGLVLNLDADSGVATDGNGIVTGWTDGSGSGNDLSSTGDPLLVTGGLNGNNIIDFDGDGDALQRLSDVNGLPTGNGDRTVFVVANYESVGNGGFTYGQARRGQAFGLVVDENGNLGVQGWGNASDQISSEAGTNQGWLVQSAQLNGGTLTQYKNGTQIDSDAVNYNTALNQILLGAEIDGSPNLDMSVASVIVFDLALSETERQQVENYLQNRYLGTSTGGGNTDPVAVDDTASTDVDLAVDIDVLANDSDLDGDPLSLSIITDPTNGTAVINDNNTPGDTSDDLITYTPNAGFTGSDSLSYQISDGNGGTAQANVAITVGTTGGNTDPVAVDDTASTDVDLAVDIDVLANDSDLDGDPLSLSITADPTNGTAVINDNNTPGDTSDDLITYTPNAGFIGSDSLSYQISDGNGGTAQAEVAITVSATGGGTDLPVTDGLVLSLDADSGVATDGNGIVTGWTDGSGSGNDLSSTGDPLLVTEGLNGNNIIDFDGDGDALQRLSGVNGLPTGNGDRTVFVVANYESVGNGGFTYGQARRGQAFGLVVDENGNLGVQGWGNASDQISSEAGTNQGWLVQSAQLNGGTLTQYKNGTQIDSDAVNYNTALNQILLGAEIDGSPNLDMSVASVIVFDRALSETERQQVENYLQNRYSI